MVKVSYMKKYVLLGIIALVALMVGPAMAGPSQGNQGFSGTLSCCVGVTVVPGNMLNFPTFALGNNFAAPVYVNETDSMCGWVLSTTMDNGNTGYMYSGALNHLTDPLTSDATWYGAPVTNYVNTPVSENFKLANTWTETATAAPIAVQHYTNWSVGYNQTIVPTDPFGSYKASVYYNIGPA